MVKITDNKRLIYFILCLSVLVTIFFTCHFSPFYPSSTDMDINMFKLMSRGMREGRVPYKDLFDHKGLWLYFVYVVGDWISFSGIDGMFFISVLCGMITTVYSYKTVSLILDDEGWRSIAVSTISTVFIYGSIYYNYAGNVEDLALPMFAISLYYLIRLWILGVQFSRYHCCLLGVFIGIIFWAKFFVLAFYVGYGIILLYRYVRNKELQSLKKLLFYGFVGFLIATIFVIIYCVCTDSLGDMFDIYIYRNIFMYKNSATELLSWYMVVISNILVCFYNSLLPLFCLLLFCVLLNQKHRDGVFSAIKPLFIVMIICFIIVFAVGLPYLYYFMPLLIWVPVTLAYTIRFVFNQHRHIIQIIVVMGILSIVSLFLNSTYESACYTDKTVEDIVNIIRSTDDQSIVLVGYGDSGIQHRLDKLSENYKLFQIGTWDDTSMREYLNYVYDLPAYILVNRSNDGTLCFPIGEYEESLVDFLSAYYSECYEGEYRFNSFFRGVTQGQIYVTLYRRNNL